MFHQVPPSVCWSSFADANTLVCVGTEAVALLCQNIVIFHDVKTNQKSYYKGDTIGTCAGISLLAGHHRFPLFAVAESVLRPSIYVYKYPEMEKLSQLQNEFTTSYIDMDFTDHGTILALSSGPNYTLHMWNYRTGVHYTHVDTYKKCSKHCIFVSPNPEIAVFQYSKWHQEIIGWEIYITSDQYRFHEMTTIKITNEFDKSHLFCVTFGETPHIVNDYGVVSSISPGHFALKLEWTVPKQQSIPKAHRIFYSKGGLLVLSDLSIYFIKKRNHEWILVWQIIDSGLNVMKMVSNLNCDIYAATNFGNIYYVDHNDEGVGSLRELSTSNCGVKDYCTLKGIKEEAVLILTDAYEIRLVDIASMNKLSSIFIENASCLITHANCPYAVVGTTTGKVYYISYENDSRTPVILAEQQLDELEILQVQLHENIAFIRDELNGFYIVHCDYNKGLFNIAMSLERKDKVMKDIKQIVLLNIQCAMMFVSYESGKYHRDVKNMWLLNWHLTDLFIQRREFQLQYIYKDFTLIEPYANEKVEFLGIRKSDYTIDLMLLEDYKTITIINTFRTNHIGYLYSISGTRNILTSATQGIIYHFQTHKNNKRPYAISRPLFTTFIPSLSKRMDECFGSKYLLVLYTDGVLLSFRLPSMKDSLKENQHIEGEIPDKVTTYIDVPENLRSQTIVEVKKVYNLDREERKNILEELNFIRKSMRDLINYDISITGQHHGIYRKFCLNSFWLAKLTEGAQILCQKERMKLLEAIKEQNSIKNWILNLIRSSKGCFSVKMRSIFSHVFLENYAMHPNSQELLDKFDYFRFYDMDLNESELEEMHEDFEEKEEQSKKLLKRYVLGKGQSFLEHVMSKDFELQEINNVTFHQMYNEEAKVQILLIDALKQEFNKEFGINKSYKQEIVSNILETNDMLRIIYCNINCMLCLLHMDAFQPSELSIPEWTRDENIDRIMTVDDSEITAVNRNRRALSKTAHKSGRILLWPLEYWKRAIMYMMDGVLEKLWEEEIKKNPLEPEFLHKKHIAEYTIEEQKILREYENKLISLEADRRKYLRLLKDSETKILNRKKHYILRWNERLMEIVLLKMKYDFAIKHEQLRLLNTRLMNNKRIYSKMLISKQRARMDRIIEYISKYTKLVDYWDRSFSDTKMKLDSQTHKDKHLDRQFKGNFLNSIPAHFTFELNKLYKRRPKLPTKAFSTAHLCYEMADRITSKKQYKFPLPQELQEFLALLDSLDDIQNCPNQFDYKHWENFIKLRRQKLESELRLKGMGYQLAETQNGINFNTKELNTIKMTRANLANSIAESLVDYFEIAQNRTLEFILTMGQVEIQIRNMLSNSKDFMIMNVNDIVDVNELIRTAGKMKVNAMQRVAFFRRQVIYKEWEHKVVRANIEYLEYVFKLIQNCKVSHELLEILRNWKRVEENKGESSALGSIERKINDKIEAANKRMRLTDKKIEIIRADIHKIRSSNCTINRQITDMKADITELTTNRDLLSEEKLARERNERLKKIKTHRILIENVRRDYVQLMELQTILELQRLRTYPTLGPAPQCTVFPE